MRLIRKYNPKTRQYETPVGQRKATPKEVQLLAKLDAISKCSSITQVRKLLAA